MKTLTKNSINEFMKYYHSFHDSSIDKIIYDSANSKIEIVFDIYWSREPSIMEDGTYDTHKTKIRMIFIGVLNFHDTKEYNCIDNAVIEFYNKDGRELINFSLQSDEDYDSTYLTVICEKIKYDEIN